jgi:UDP-N-acetylglucosamine acyltransferase
MGYKRKRMSENTIDMKEYPKRKGNYIHPTAVIGPHVQIGDGNYIGPFCIIGYPAEHKGYWLGPKMDTFGGKQQAGKVIIGDNNVFTGHVTIDAGTERETRIGDNNWFLKHSHMGHDAIVGFDNTISCGAKIGGHCILKNNINIGLNACIHQRIEIPNGCMIGMNAAVTKRLEMSPYRKYAGVPAKDIGSNIRE